VLDADGHSSSVDYEPAESTSDLLEAIQTGADLLVPMNFLLIESLQRIHYYYGDGFKVEYPRIQDAGVTLWNSPRIYLAGLSHIFLRRDGLRGGLRRRFRYFKPTLNGAT